VFKDGSFGVGGSPRAAPVGLIFHHDLAALIEAAAASAEVTHSHPLGRAGAVTVALAVALAVRRVTPRDMYYQIQDLLAASAYADFVPHLAVAEELLESWPSPPQVVEHFGGNELTAPRCVPAALYSVLRHPDSFEKAVGFAVSLGGDSDSMGAMAGAMAGAYHGTRGIPTPWVERLENEERGRDTVIELGERLYAAWQEWFGGR
jgi:poly(ADP-ribose) glycohydrolase ARH3